MDFGYKLEQFIIDKKENIIIDNSLLSKNSIFNVKCENIINSKKGKDNISNNKIKNNKIINQRKMSKKKKVMMGSILVILLLYLIINCCFSEKNEYSDYSSTSTSSSISSISSSNYVGETSGLLNRRW